MSIDLPAVPSIEYRPAVPYASVTRDGITPATFPEIADRIPEIIGWLRERGLAPAGAPFLKYDVIGPGDTFRVQAGVPLPSPVEDDGEIVSATLPAGGYVACLHTGHPDRLAEVAQAVVAWGTAQGLTWDRTESGGTVRWAAYLETFLTHPKEVPDPGKWVTEVALKLADGLPRGADGGTAEPVG
ncbi:MAG TPA: GyrI-like domain-containing protein [Spirillospora sp.]